MQQLKSETIQKLEKAVLDMKLDGSYYYINYLTESTRIFVDEMKNNKLTKEDFCKCLDIPVDHYYGLLTGKKYNSIEERSRLLFMLGYDTEFSFKKIEGKE